MERTGRWMSSAITKAIVTNTNKSSSALDMKALLEEMSSDKYIEQEFSEYKARMQAQQEYMELLLAKANLPAK